MRAFAQVRRLGLSPATEEELRRQRPDANGLLVIDQVLPGGPAQHKLEVRGARCGVRLVATVDHGTDLADPEGGDPDPPSTTRPPSPLIPLTKRTRTEHAFPKTHGIIAHRRSVTSCCRSTGSRPTVSSRSSTPSTPPQSLPSLPSPLAVAPVGPRRLSRRRRPLRVMARAQFASSSNEAVSAWR